MSNPDAWGIARATPIVLLSLLLLPGGSSGGTREAAEKVRQGVSHFRARDYEKAAAAFSDADVALPEDRRIAFDRACAYAARGDNDKATELFQQAALSQDPQLAVGAQYNLGSLAAQRARAKFEDKPEDASAEVRSEGLGLLLQAVGHYRDCLKLDEHHANARHNLEVIRLWIKHMEALWQERDRQKQREEMDLLSFLQMIEGEQRSIRTLAQTLADQPDSPQRRQAFVTAESSQRKLAEEIGPLKEKIRAELESAAQAQSQVQGSQPPTSPAPTSNATEEAVGLLTGLADDTHKAMLSAADKLAGRNAGAAVDQAEAVEQLDQIYMAIVPFPTLVQRAIGVEQGLVDTVAPAVESPDEEEGPDYAELSWNQRFVFRWSEVMVPKAEQGLKGLDQVDPSAMASPATGAQPGAPDPEETKKQIEALKKSMQKAVELAPKVQSLTDEAATLLGEEKPAGALPKQEEALKLLKEIAEPLPKQDQQQQGDQQQKQDQQDEEQQGGDQQQRQRRQPQDLSKQQAESVLRKARERQRDRRRQEKELQDRIYRPGAVDKDW